MLIFGGGTTLQWKTHVLRKDSERFRKMGRRGGTQWGSGDRENLGPQRYPSVRDILLATSMPPRIAAVGKCACVLSRPAMMKQPQMKNRWCWTVEWWAARTWVARHGWSEASVLNAASLKNWERKCSLLKFSI